MCMFPICVSVCFCLHMLISLFLPPHPHCTPSSPSLMLGLINVHHDTLMKRQNCGANRGEIRHLMSSSWGETVSLWSRSVVFKDLKDFRCDNKQRFLSCIYQKVLKGTISYKKNVQPVTWSSALILLRFISVVPSDPLPPFTCSNGALIFHIPPPAAAALGEGGIKQIRPTLSVSCWLPTWLDPSGPSWQAVRVCVLMCVCACRCTWLQSACDGAHACMWVMCSERRWHDCVRSGSPQGPFVFLCEPIRGFWHFVFFPLSPVTCFIASCKNVTHWDWTAKRSLHRSLVWGQWYTVVW